MKISRDGLKALIKECLIELLEEGMKGPQEHATVVREQKVQPARPRQTQSRAATPPQSSRPRPSLAAAIARQQPARPKPPVIQESPTDILDSIFAHTAQTTLRTQATHGHTAPSYASENTGTSYADVSAQVMSEHAPEDVFGDESAGKWSKLAFQNPVLDRGGSPTAVNLNEHIGRDEDLERRIHQVAERVMPQLDFDPFNPPTDE